MSVTDRDVCFPCDTMPANAAVARLLGLYPQRQEGRWMQRVKVLGGILSPGQWRALGAIAREFTPGTPLHLTTRQEIELHDLTRDQVPSVQRCIAEMGLTGRGACGDTLRNITVCPCSGVREDAPDLIPLAWEIRKALEAEAHIYSLSRKFKISLSACGEACGQPWINDLGFAATRDDERWSLFVTVAGSLGARPGCALKLFDAMPVGGAVPLAVAAVRFFNKHGDREVRSRARLRHVRERLGDEAFTRLLLDEFERTKSQRHWPRVELGEPQPGFTERLTLTLPNGDVWPEVAEALAELCEEPDVRVRIGIEHRVIVFGRDECLLELAGQRREVLQGAMEIQPSVVACPGTRWCSRGLVDTNSLADGLRQALADVPGADLTVCISGCPNGCAHSRVAEVGLVGRRVKTRSGESVEAFDLYLGGGRGVTDRLAELHAERLSPGEAIRSIAKL